MDRPRATLPTLLIALVLAVAACGGATAGDPVPGSGTGAGSDLTVDVAWARASSRIGGITAAYLSISNAAARPRTVSSAWPPRSPRWSRFTRPCVPMG